MSENLSPFPDDAPEGDAPDGDAPHDTASPHEVQPRSDDDARSRDTDDETSWGFGRHRHYRRSTGSWIAGAILVAVGLIFLLENTGIRVPFLDNWWALFILIPAIGAFGRGAAAIRANGGQVDRVARSAFFWGFILVLVTVGLLFSVDWRFLWPVLLILAGVGALLTAVAGR